MIRLVKLISIALLSISLLSGCKSDEERAEEYYQSGLKYLEQGDVDRALIEFRNVFRKNGFHREARRTYAKLQLERGEVAEAYGQFLRLVEQYPDDIDARVTLAQLALDRNDWREAERHGKVAIEAAPDQPAVMAISAALDYRAALEKRDEAAQAKAAEKARKALAADPSLLTARRILVDRALNAEDYPAALEQVNAALEQTPDKLELNMLKAQLLARENDSAALGTQLKAMYEKFPENDTVGKALIQWYMAQKDYDGAEAFLRGKAGADDAAPEGHLTVVQFLRSARGVEAARTELDRLIEATKGTQNADMYIAARAMLDFEQGDRADAIAQVENVLKSAEPSDQTRRIKVTLARMLAATGNVVGARARIEEVLAEDATNVEALKMRAAWLIQSDQSDQAIIDLRTALDQSPRDTAILTLMAEAHMRNGSPELAQERLALAVEVSGNSPAETLRYARFVLQRNRPGLAQSVLAASLKGNPGNLEIIALLADIYVGERNWSEAQRLVEMLKDMKGDKPAELSRTIESAILLGQKNVDDSLALLRQNVQDPTGEDFGAVLRILRTQISTGRIEEARGYLDGLLKENPDNLALKLMDANVLTLEDKPDAAERRYREILADKPALEPAILQLSALLRKNGQLEEADKVMNAGLKAVPKSRQLRLLKAGRLEQTGDIDGAIAMYEDMYADNSNDVVVANNLASLLSMYRDTPEALSRAEVISRRLNGSNVPAFLDTLGWVQYLNGRYDDAIPNLEAASRGLPDDPSVALHLGLAYAAKDRKEEARASLERGLKLAGDRPLPEVERARKALQDL